MIRSMRPLRVTSPVLVPDHVGVQWWVGGPVCVYDGSEPESSPGMGGVEIPCGSCTGRISLDLERLKISRPLNASSRLERALAAAFGLGETPAPRPPSDQLGLPGHFLEAACRTCGAQHGVVLGFGEFQPGRWLVTFVGMASVEVDERERGATTAVVAAVTALVLVVGAVVGAHFWVWSIWRTGTGLQTAGVLVTAELVDTRTSQGPRSDGYWLTVRFESGGVVIEGEKSVDRATFDRALGEDVVPVRHDPERPDRFDIDGNDRRSTALFVLAVVDSFVVAAAVRIARDVRRDRPVR